MRGSCWGGRPGACRDAGQGSQQGREGSTYGSLTREKVQARQQQALVPWGFLPMGLAIDAYHPQDRGGPPTSVHPQLRPGEEEREGESNRAPCHVLQGLLQAGTPMVPRAGGAGEEKAGWVTAGRDRKVLTSKHSAQGNSMQAAGSALPTGLQGTQWRLEPPPGRPG